jgi:alpha-glucuronidase
VGAVESSEFSRKPCRRARLLRPWSENGIHKKVADRLAIHVADAAKWRDRILEFFGRFSKRPILRSS